MKSYTIYINYKGNKRALLNGTFGEDGSFYFSEMLSKYLDAPWGIMVFDMPLNKVGMGMNLKASALYYVTRPPKMAHHSSGFFHISGKAYKSILSGEENGVPRGVAVNSFNPNNSTNDGGPTFTGYFWGLNDLPEYRSKSSEEICFTESEINEQRFTYEGKRIAFVIHIFHFLPFKITDKEREDKEKWYEYRHFKRPVRLKLISDSKENYFLGISCMKARTRNEELIGCNLSGGAGLIDKKTGLCRSTALLFPSQDIANNSESICLDNRDWKFT